jgi:hypothetical protein
MAALILVAFPLIGGNVWAGNCERTYRGLTAAIKSQSPRAQIAKTILANSFMLTGVYYPLFLPSLAHLNEKHPKFSLAWNRFRRLHLMGLGGLGVWYGTQSYQEFQQQLEDDKNDFTDELLEATNSIEDKDTLAKRMAAELEAASHNLSPENQKALQQLLQESTTP